MSSLKSNIRNNYNLDESPLNLKVIHLKTKKRNIYYNFNILKYIIKSINIFFLFFLIIKVRIPIKKNEIYNSNSNSINNYKIKLSKKNYNFFISNVKNEELIYNNSKIYEETLIRYEKNMPHLKELNKKRKFDHLLPLPKEIKCKPHFFSNEELIAFISFLTKDNIFFETGSGCSSIIAKYYAKKTISIEGSKTWYEEGIKNGLKNSMIFKNLKTDNQNWSIPGNKSNLEDWKNYFQSYKEEYNADIIFLDGRFKVATAMDIFNKIKDDTIILIHEYKSRPSYFILENYYNYIYHWNTLYALIKKKEINEIPLEIQKKYWNDFI